MRLILIIASFGFILRINFLTSDLLSKKGALTSVFFKVRNKKERKKMMRTYRVNGGR